MRRLLFLLLALLAIAVPQAAADTMLGEQRVLVLLVTWGPEPFSRETVEGVVLGEAGTWFRDASYGRTALSGDVTPWLKALATRPECNQRFISRVARDAAQAAGYNLASYKRFVFLHPRIDCPFAGQGSGEQAWLNGVLWRSLVVHELGHTYGLPHANTWECRGGGCSAVEYGNPYSVMGNGEGHFGAHEKFSLGWLSNVATAGKAGEYELRRLEVETAAPQALKVTTARNEYWLEYRAATPDARGRTLAGGVLVNAGANPFAMLDAIPEYGQYNLLLPNPAGRGTPALVVGDRFREPGAFEVTVNAADESVVRLGFAWLDTTRPLVKSVDRPRRAGRFIEVSWTEARESGSGVGYYEVALDGAVPRRIETGLSTATATFLPKPPRGTHVVSVVAVDRAGNRSTRTTRRFTVT